MNRKFLCVSESKFLNFFHQEQPSTSHQLPTPAPPRPPPQRRRLRPKANLFQAVPSVQCIVREEPDEPPQSPEDDSIRRQGILGQLHPDVSDDDEDDACRNDEVRNVFPKFQFEVHKWHKSY